MAAALVTLAEMKSFLGIASGTTTFDTILQTLLDQTEDLLNLQCGRKHRPFAAAQSARAETRDGNGTDRLVLDYAIATLTSVKLGRDSSDPEETLDISDVDVLAYVAGKRTLVRVDGGLFGCKDEPRVVHVVYDAAADLPNFAKLGLQRGVSLVFRQFGSEGSSRESLSGHSIDYASLETDPMWKAAVASGEIL